MSLILYIAIMKNLWISIKITLAMCVVLFVGYVLVLRLIAWVASPTPLTRFTSGIRLMLA